MKHVICALVALALSGMAAGVARGDHRDLALFASPDLLASGLTRFLVPRFSLKTGVGVHVKPLNGAVPGGGVALGETASGQPVLRRGDRVYAVSRAGPGDKAATRFIDWLLSDIGQRTIEQFAPETGPGYVGAAYSGPLSGVAPPTGDAARGEELAYAKCARCHVIGTRNRMKGIGSTPSFGVLRSLGNWQERFQTFFARAPHPAFSQIEDVSEPFNPARPSPISPLSLTLEELDDIIRFTDGIEPADLGAPLVHQ